MTIQVRPGDSVRGDNSCACIAHVVVVVVVFKGVYISSHNNIDAIASVRGSKGDSKIFQAEIMVSITQHSQQLTIINNYHY